MSAIEIMTVMQDLKPSGANAALPGNISADSSSDFIGIMNMTMAEYRNQDHNEEILGREPEDNQTGKIFFIVSDASTQTDWLLKMGEASTSSGEIATMPADKNNAEDLEETVPATAFIATFIDKMIPGSKTVSTGETGSETLPVIQKEGKRVLAGRKEFIVNETNDNPGKQNREIFASPAMRNRPLATVNSDTNGELENQLVTTLDDKGFSAEEIRDILNAVDVTKIKYSPADRLAQTKNKPEMKDQLVMALEGKGTPRDVIAGILKAVDQLTDQEIMPKAPGAEQASTVTSPVQVEPTSPSFSQAVIAILEQKGFSAEDSKDILKAVAGRAFKVTPSEESLPGTIQPEMKDQLVMALEGKGTPRDVIAGILKAVDKLADQAIMPKAAGAEQDFGRKSPVQVEPIAPSFSQSVSAILEQKGLSAEDSKDILKAVAGRAFKVTPSEESLPGTIQPEMKDQLVMALEGKGTPMDVIADILKAVDKLADQAIMPKAAGAEQDSTVTSPVQVETIAPSLSQSVSAILEQKGFSPEDIKSILNAFDQVTVGKLTPDVRPRSDQQIFVQQFLYNKENIKEANVDGRKIHADIFQKEASWEEFGHENVEARFKINPPEKEMGKDGSQKELSGQPENNQPAEKKHVFAGAVRGMDNKQSATNDKGMNAQQPGKVNTVTDQDIKGKLHNSFGNISPKETSHAGHEDIILSGGREQGSFNPEIMGMAAKGNDFQAGKSTMDNTKSIYQSVVDQIHDSFSFVKNKDNGQVRLTLKPEIMGNLDMQITVRNETIQIMMTVENEKVHQAMNAHIDELKTALQNQGLKIDKIEVALQYQHPDKETSFYQDQANSGYKNHGHNDHHERVLNQELSLGDDRVLENIQGIIRKQNTMEGVSIFA